MFKSIAQAVRPAMQSTGPAMATGTQAAVAVIVVYAEIAIIAAAGYGSYVGGKRIHTWIKSWRVVQDPPKPATPGTSALKPAKATIVATADRSPTPTSFPLDLQTPLPIPTGGAFRLPGASSG